MSESSATYFGKTPQHADFVRGRGNHKLISLLDDWLARSMKQICHTPDWKSTYDNTEALNFAFLGPASMYSIIGSLRASRDQAGRRFPFLTAAVIQRNDARLFRCAPSGLANSYSTLSTLTDSTVNGMNLNELQEKLDRLDFARYFDSAISNDPLGSFARETTLEALSTILGGRNTTESLARTILAIGLLMQKLLILKHSPINKELELPLPKTIDEKYWQVAGLWLYLITAFIRTPGMELQIVFERNATSPRMLIGFNGAAAHPLCSALIGRTTNERTLCLIDPPWISEQHVTLQDVEMRKLTSYLAQPTLSLERILISFREAFLKIRP